jgi:hypothetical protein
MARNGQFQIFPLHEFFYPFFSFDFYYHYILRGWWWWLLDLMAGGGGIFVYVVIREQQESYHGYVANESSMISISHHSYLLQNWLLDRVCINAS